MSQVQSPPSLPVYLHIENGITAISRYLAWTNLALVAVIIIQVVLRKVFSNGQISLEELQWHLYATAVMFGTAYAQVTNLHVRVDLFYHTLASEKKPLSTYSASCFWLCLLSLSLFCTLMILPTSHGG